MPPVASHPNPQEQPQHVVINLDTELVCQALVEALNLLESLQAQLPQSHPCSAICSQIRLRVSYAVLHSAAPEFRAESLRTLALFHQRSAISLWRAQRHLHQMHLSNPS